MLEAEPINVCVVYGNWCQENDDIVCGLDDLREMRTLLSPWDMTLMLLMVTFGFRLSKSYLILVKLVAAVNK